MERIQALIDRLIQQQTQGSSAAQLLVTVDILRNELLHAQQKTGTLGTAKVAVTLPVSLNFSEEIIRNGGSATMPAPEPVKEVAEAPKPAPVAVDGNAESKYEPVAANDARPKEYALRKPSFHAPEPQHAAYLPPEAETKIEPNTNPAFALAEEPVAPTAVSTQRKELHEVIGEKQASMNEKLKQEQRELGHHLKDAPIKDLKKAIGINDRFTFINELFRGDEAMYERSIKTINGFNIFSEAEFWINRELKLKLNWNEDAEPVQRFGQLVRRRFS